MKNLLRSIPGILIVFITAAGCGDQGSNVAEGANQDHLPFDDASVDLIRTADDAAFRQAFENLKQYDYVRNTTTIQRSERGGVRASKEQVARYSWKEGERVVEILSSDSTGGFDFGAWERYVDRQPDAVEPEELADQILPEDPPYLAERNREIFEYQTLPDTTISGTRVRVVEVRARPEEAEDQQIRLARYYVEPGTNRLIAIYLARTSQSILFRENTAVYAQLARAQNGEWLPDEFLTTTYISLPVIGDYQFETTSRYQDYAAAVKVE